MPIQNLWGQLIDEVQPKLVITTGTAGGIGAELIVGDVVVAPAVQFDCTADFKNRPFHDSKYPCSSLETTSFATATKLFQANAAHLPTASARPRSSRNPRPRRPTPMSSRRISSRTTIRPIRSICKGMGRRSRWAMRSSGWSSRG